MTPTLIFLCFLAYTALLFVITYITAWRSTNRSFFIGNKASPWFVVAYGMIGASMSGVTFMSVPGWVGSAGFSSMMVVVGYLFGYAVIATILLPLYYRMNLTSIYSYLESRFGFWSYRTGAFYFILSRVIGASFRMFLVVNVLQVFVFDAWNIPFFVTVMIFIILILLYTFKGGIRTIIWTDTIQTTFMLLALVLSIWLIIDRMGLSAGEMIDRVYDSSYSRMIFTDWTDRHFFIKELLSGAFMAIVMTGLDQEMMQKNISVRNLKDSQKNMITFSVIMVFVNLLFLLLGGLLYIYAFNNGAAFTTNLVDNKEVFGLYHNQLNITGDNLFPSIALGLFQQLPVFISVIFIIALISALFPSADGALTALTSSFCIDILGLKDRQDMSEKQKRNTRLIVHFSMTIIFFICILVFREINSRSIIDKILDLAGYTYGPLLGLFAFGILTKRSLPNSMIIALIALASPVLCYLLQTNSASILGGYKIGIEILLLNGTLTFLGLLIISKKSLPE